MDKPIGKSLDRKEQRLKFAQELVEAALEAGWTVERNEESLGYRSVCFNGPRLSVSTSLTPRQGFVLLHWHGAEGQLRGHSAAWQSVNQFHRHKATSFPNSLPEAVAMLAEGMRAANSGEAFLPDPTEPLGN